MSERGCHSALCVLCLALEGEITTGDNKSPVGRPRNKYSRRAYVLRATVLLTLRAHQHIQMLHAAGESTHTRPGAAACSLRPHHTRLHGFRACTCPCAATPQHHLATLAAARGGGRGPPELLRQRCMRQAACRDLRAEQRAESSDTSRGTRHQAGQTGAPALNAVRTAQLDRPGASACPSRRLARTLASWGATSGA